MDVSSNMLGTLTPETARVLIPTWLCSFMQINPDERRKATDALREEIAQFDNAELSRSLTYLRTLGDDYALYKADPVAQTMARAHTPMFH